MQDARIGIRSMLQSPFLGDMRQEVEFWDSALQQVEEITELWFQCQKKVMFQYSFCLELEFLKNVQNISDS